MKRVKYNKEFETIDTQEKAYILGLYYSDGYVAASQKFTGITLHKQDASILYKIEEMFPFLYTAFDISKPTVVLLRCNQQAYCKDLILQGVLPNKSFGNSTQLKFPAIDRELYPHFIRGFFDGDGSVFLSKTASPNCKICTFTGVCHNFLLELKDVLEEAGIQFRCTVTDNSAYSSTHKGKVIKGCSNLMNLILSNRVGIEKFYAYLYDDSVIGFIRKQTIMGSWVDLSTPRLPCRLCGCIDTIYHGADRLHCKRCSRYMPRLGPIHVKMPTVCCKHCGGTKTVGNGKTRSKTDGRIVSQVFLCRDCKKNSSYSVETAPLKSNL